MTNYITCQGYERILRQYTRLVDIELPELLLKMRGAIHENFAAEQARRDHAVLEARIRALKPFVESPVFIDDLIVPVDVVGIGTSVEIEDVESGEIENYTILGETEADPAQGLISWQSPLARAILGSEVGDLVRFQLPSRVEPAVIRVLSITRAFGQPTG